MVVSSQDEGTEEESQTVEEVTEDQEQVVEDTETSGWTLTLLKRECWLHNNMFLLRFVEPASSSSDAPPTMEPSPSQESDMDPGPIRNQVHFWSVEKSQITFLRKVSHNFSALAPEDKTEDLGSGVDSAGTIF